MTVIMTGSFRVSRSQTSHPFRYRGPSMRWLLIIAVMALSSAALGKATPPDSAKCAACHGATGVGNKAAGYPAPAAQSARYLFWQLMDFKRGTRKNLVMVS